MSEEFKGRRGRDEVRPALTPVDIAAVTTRVLGVDPARYDGFDTGLRSELLGRVKDIDSLIAALSGEMNRTIAALTPRPERTRRAEDAVVDEICAARRVGCWTGERMILTARLCDGPGAPLVPLQDALLAGATSPAHMEDLVGKTTQVVDDVLSPDELEAGVTARTRAQKLAEIAAGTHTSLLLDIPSRYRKVLDAAITRVDGEAEAERRRAALSRRDVFTGRKLDDPLASMTLLDDPSVVQRLMTNVNARARRLQLGRGGRRAAATCPEARIGSCRADVLVELIDALTAEDPDLPEGCQIGPLPDDVDIEPLPADFGQAARHPRRQGFLVMDLATLRGEQNNPCLLDGHPIPAAMGRAEAAMVDKWRRMVTDPVTGQLLDYGRSVYLPSPLTDFVRHRDGKCLIPFCERQAMNCQCDHDIPFPKGPSSAVNCGLLCDRHHPLKTEKYEHLVLDEASGWVRYETAWGQVLEVCAHPYMPSWDDEPYDVVNQRYPTRAGPPDDPTDVTTDAGTDDAHDPDPPPEPEAARTEKLAVPEDDEPPF